MPKSNGPPATLSENPYCHNSPTQRHHWLLGATNDGVTAGACKYCPVTRTFGKPYKPTRGRPMSPVRGRRDISPWQ